MIRRLTESLVIDSTKVRRVLDWKPPYSMEEELARTAEWYYDSQKSYPSYIVSHRGTKARREMKGRK